MQFLFGTKRMVPARPVSVWNVFPSALFERSRILPLYRCLTICLSTNINTILQRMCWHISPNEQCHHKPYNYSSYMFLIIPTFFVTLHGEFDSFQCLQRTFDTIYLATAIPVPDKTPVPVQTAKDRLVLPSRTVTYGLTLLLRVAPSLWNSMPSVLPDTILSKNICET